MGPQGCFKPKSCIKPKVNVFGSPSSFFSARTANSSKRCINKKFFELGDWKLQTLQNFNRFTLWRINKSQKFTGSAPYLGNLCQNPIFIEWINYSFHISFYLDLANLMFRILRLFPQRKQATRLVFHVLILSPFNATRYSSESRLHIDMTILRYKCKRTLRQFVPWQLIPWQLVLDNWPFLQLIPYLHLQASPPLC